MATRQVHVSYLEYPEGAAQTTAFAWSVQEVEGDWSDAEAVDTALTRAMEVCDAHLAAKLAAEGVDAPDKPGHDGGEVAG